MQDFVERANQAGHRGLGQRPRTMSGRATRVKLNPAGRFLGDVNIVRALAVTDADATTFGEEKLGIGNQLKMVVNKPTGALTPTFFFVCRTKENKVTFERY